MLILLYGVDDESAFDMLRQQPQIMNVKLRALAEQLVSDYRVLSNGEALPPARSTTSANDRSQVVHPRPI
jgi:hypothetical protein